MTIHPRAECVTQDRALRSVDGLAVNLSYHL